MSKKIKIVVAFLLAMCLFAGCSGQQASNQDNAQSGQSQNSDLNQGNSAASLDAEMPAHTIAVAVATYSTAIMDMQDYYTNYLGPALNVKFIFSEEIGTDVANIMSFVENAYNSGAEAVIDYACTSPADVQPIAAKCDELGMYFVTWYMEEGILDGYEYAVGSVGVDEQNAGQAYDEAIRAVADDGENHSLVLCTMNARYGNGDHIISCASILRAYQDIYGLEYTDTPENLVQADTITTIETGNDNIKIALFPSYSGDDMKEVLKSGEYDTVAVVGPVYLRFESVISEMESLFDKNIRVISYTGVADSTANSFNTKDSFGESTLNAAVLENNSRYTLIAALAINAVNGDVDAVKENGAIHLYGTYIWPCLSAEEYAQISVIDKDESSYIYTIDEVKQMLKFYNADMTWETIAEWAAKSGVDSIMERRGLS